MSNVSIDPFLVGVAVLIVLAVWAWWPFVEALGEMSGLLAADAPEDSPPVWLVVVGGWSLGVMVLWAAWIGLDWLVG
jgi:hypothetical protein